MAEIYNKTSMTSDWRPYHYTVLRYDGSWAAPLDRSGNPVTQPRINSLSGYRNPYWRDQIRLGENATTPLTGNMWQARTGEDWFAFGSEVRYLARNTGGLQYYLKEDTGISIGMPWGWTATTPPASVVTQTSNRVIARFLSKIQDATSAFESGQDLGEFRETLRGIHQPLESLKVKLLSYFDELEKVRSRSRNRIYLSKALADTYLEFRFGWLPLADDVASAISKVGLIRPKTIPISASSHEVHSVSDTLYLLGNIIAFSYQGLTVPYIRAHQKSEYYIRYKGAVRARVDPNGRSSVARELQLLPSNWLPTAWDLLPYSWIADYFTNIGDIISALTFCFGDLAWGQKTVRNKTTWTYHDLYMSVPDPWYLQLSNPNLQRDLCVQYVIPATNPSYTVTSLSRTPLVSTDFLPQFAFRIPTSKYPYLNLGALLLSRASKLVPFF